jgi:DNA polymerase I
MSGSFTSVWFVDFEFHQPPGERPVPLCISGLEYFSGRRVRLWLADGAPLKPPFSIDENTLIVAFYASAEMSCFEALGWPRPPNVLDLYAEQRVATNGLVLDPEDRGRSLLKALRFYGIPHDVGEHQKTEMRDLAIRRGPHVVEEKSALMAYCDTDTDALLHLYRAMHERIDFPRAVHVRGKFVAAVAKMELAGVPIDVATLNVLVARQDCIKNGIRYLANARYENVFVDGSFSSARFGEYLRRRRMSWPRLERGRLALDDKTFKTMARVHPELKLLRDARRILTNWNLTKPMTDSTGNVSIVPKFTVGFDSRNRALLSPFATKTGRSQPKSSQFVLSSHSWLRGGLIQPQPGWGLAYVDWVSAEFGIAAALSGDKNMLAAYESGDPYFWFAKKAGYVPADGVRADFDAVRTMFKVVVLAVGYGQSAESLGVVLGIQTAYAEELLRLHRAMFPKFWEWSDAVSTTADAVGRLRTRHGWPLHVSAWTDNDRSLRNFPVQATCAALLHVAAILATERGVRILGTLHDAFLIEAIEAEVGAAIDNIKAAMAHASKMLLDGFELATEDKIERIVHPQRLAETETWIEVMNLLGLR